MQDLYFKVILPSVAYGLKLWGSCYNSNLFQSVERLYCRAARLIFNLPKDMASAEVLQRAQWPTLSIYHKSAIFICFHKAFHDRLPVTLIDLISKKRATNYSTRTRASTRVTWKTLSRLEAQSYGTQWPTSSALTKNILYRHLRLQLKSLVNFNDLSFKITSSSTCNFKKDDFVYT